LLIASGILREQADSVSAAFADVGLVEKRRLVSGDWAAFLAT
jgi:ribosomal protein L11 methylase PrmA